MNRKPKDMFKMTQRRLTLQYSGVLIAFLLLFVASVYGLLYYLLINDQKNELGDFIDEEIHALHEITEHSNMNELQRNFAAFIQDAAGGQYPFYLSTEGDFYFGRNFPDNYQDIAQNYAPVVSEDSSVVFSNITIQESGLNIRNTRVDRLSQVEGKFLLAGMQMTIEGSNYGTLYAVKEVTGEYRLFNRLLLVFAGIGLLFCGAALLLSARMSAKAMIPVRRSYQRQQEFVADASHELRTPLSVIQSSLDALEMEELFDNEPFAGKLFGHLKDEAKRMTDLTGSLLTLARSDAEEQPLALTHMDFTETVRVTAETFRALAEECNIALSVEDDPAVWIQADSNRIRQLIVILLDNAIKYTPPGGKVTLSVKMEGDKRKMMAFSVADTGIGIPEEDMERIFERFYRVDKSRAREHGRQGGHGLGLSIAKWIAEAHNGILQVTSNKSGGSVFTLLLPL